jgi:SanA protein
MPTRSGCVIVVLGCPPLLANDQPNAYFMGRIEAAAALHRDAPEAPILCSGGIDARGRDEALWLARALARRGVPTRNLEIDSDSPRTRHSIQTAFARHPERTPIFVSQPFHLPRVAMLARRRGADFRIHAAPGPSPSRKIRLREFVAHWRARFER